jgi:hypothetical protein
VFFLRVEFATYGKGCRTLNGQAGNYITAHFMERFAGSWRNPPDAVRGGRLIRGAGEMISPARRRH